MLLSDFEEVQFLVQVKKNLNSALDETKGIINTAKQNLTEGSYKGFEEIEDMHIIAERAGEEDDNLDHEDLHTYLGGCYVGLDVLNATVAVLNHKAKVVDARLKELRVTDDVEDK